jgi:23S rRNA pseudouridine1911/1915/1917 synthase
MKQVRDFLIPIVYEDQDILVINKPQFLQVHPDRVTKRKTLVDFLVKKYPQIKTVGDDPKLRPGIVHRLDKETSGIMLVMKNNQAFAYFKNLFRQKKIKKTYLALVHGQVRKQTGEIDLAVGRSLKDTAVRTTSNYAKDKKEAKTKYQVLNYYLLEKSKSKKYYYTLLKVQPETGRTHQIRVHLKAINYPIVGDPIYKFKRLVTPKDLEKLCLIATELKFKDRKDNLREFKIDLRSDFQKALSSLLALPLDEC